MNEAVKKGVDGEAEDTGPYKRLEQCLRSHFCWAQLTFHCRASICWAEQRQLRPAPVPLHVCHHSACQPAAQHMEPAARMASVTNNTWGSASCAFPSAWPKELVLFCNILDTAKYVQDWAPKRLSYVVFSFAKTTCAIAGKRAQEWEWSKEKNAGSFLLASQYLTFCCVAFSDLACMT